MLVQSPDPDNWPPLDVFLTVRTANRLATSGITSVNRAELESELVVGKIPLQWERIEESYFRELSITYPPLFVAHKEMVWETAVVAPGRFFTAAAIFLHFSAPADIFSQRQMFHFCW